MFLHKVTLQFYRQFRWAGRVAGRPSCAMRGAIAPDAIAAAVQEICLRHTGGMVHFSCMAVILPCLPRYSTWWLAKAPLEVFQVFTRPWSAHVESFRRHALQLTPRAREHG